MQIFWCWHYENPFAYTVNLPSYSIFTCYIFWIQLQCRRWAVTNIWIPITSSGKVAADTLALMMQKSPIVTLMTSEDQGPSLSEKLPYVTLSLLISGELWLFWHIWVSDIHSHICNDVCGRMGVFAIYLNLLITNSISIISWFNFGTPLQRSKWPSPMVSCQRVF